MSTFVTTQQTITYLVIIFPLCKLKPVMECLTNIVDKKKSKKISSLNKFLAIGVERSE